MTDFETVRVERAETVASIVMDRPERRNALNPQLDQDLRDAFEYLSDDDSVRAVVLRGAGDGFCSGADLTILKDDPTPEEIYEHVTERYVPLIQNIVQLPVPVLAAIHGTAAGAGMAIALACDLRVMAENAQVVLAFSNIGFVPDSGASYLLARQVGYSRAFELAAEAAPLPARECLDLGLTNRVAPPDHVVESATSWAHQLAERPTRALAGTKRVLQYAMDHSLDETMTYEAVLQKEMVQTDDHKEGVQAFLEKRPPEFSGS